ncbi:MAG: hypothetical protein FWE70_02685 [Oscillospiraceae bacterium]|nr:hypothetical protein [Oscillospiraceae bacterium]
MVGREGRVPDFGRLRETLMCGRADAVPIAELFHDVETVDAYMGREVGTYAELAGFYAEAGFDYLPFDAGKWFAGAKGEEGQRAERRAAREARKARTHLTEDVGRRFHIEGPADFEAYDWRMHGWLRGGGDLSAFDEAAGALAPGMKVIAWSDGIFEFFTKMVGYGRFCHSLADDAGFVERVFKEVGDRAVRAYERVAAHPSVGALWLADDIGYSEGLLLSPEIMRKHLFPHYESIGEIARANGKPFIFHSDGRLWEILPDLLRAGVNGLQPIETKAWDAREVKRRYGGRLCVMGTIDLDLLCRGTRGEVEAMVRAHIDGLGKGGGFVIGTSNTPTYYMDHGNYRAMLETAMEHGVYGGRVG